MRFTKVFAAAALGIAALLGATTYSPGVLSVARADDTPPPIVEDGDYPDKAPAAAIGIVLKKGNGKIQWVDCAKGGDLMKVEAESINDTRYPGTDARAHTGCFVVLGSNGFLSLEIKATTFIRKDSSHKMKATTIAKANGQEVKREYDITRDTATPVGEGPYPEEGPATLLELRSV
ncbi:hypothetical protein D5S17_15745 [Pseudonocardiaceae bacterium YIM PH 21723]|nr:hypothetical protein D5S17_15745 [Pseudonocardiaceae bacterium YIM PH 21723]